MSAYISSFAADMIGFVGMFCIVSAYAYSNIAQQMNLLLFNGVNLLGAILLMISLTVNFNLPSMVLEAIWMMIAIFGIIKALRQKSNHQKSDDTPETAA